MYKVKTVSTILNIPISSLHYYEKIGLLVPQRGHNNYRYYTDTDIQILKMIVIMRTFNFSIQEIQEIIKRYNFGNCSVDTNESARKFFEEKCLELERQANAYLELITLIKTLPVFSEQHTDFIWKRKKISELTDVMYNKIMNNSK